MSSRSLSEVQNFLAEAIRKSTPLANDAEMAKFATSIAKANARLSPLEQIEIYREQFVMRHVEALEADYVSVVHLLGHEKFHELAMAYITTNPPSSFTLRDLGSQLARFVSITEPYASDPLIAELARLEWAFVEAFDAPDAPHLDPRKIEAATEADWANAVVILHPSLQRLKLAYPSHNYRSSVREAVRNNEIADGLRPDPSAYCIVVYRGLEAIQYVEEDEAAFELLDQLAQRVNINDACEKVFGDTSLNESQVNEMEEKISFWFQRWTSFGWVTDVQF